MSGNSLSSLNGPRQEAQGPDQTPKDLARLGTAFTSTAPTWGRD